ncbi:uncharacterized protein CC84DRAFT_1205861 [Paraphaeosphaeria sporulosa]|uniref:Uncharacterized protein n=1 Tax=Paraphaeosphaeria sporulosa TaxID=1460663 RepID=A0A177CHS7_9PLEO|nr:uncharacterized protein CC84DRAFT_1205861 [Paraphaeosphaeria sporulosa]OAG06340.1 hypothetical protein CC84DRAFT_1205861 [Paraphaeosphaeria sporulosa]
MASRSKPEISWGRPRVSGSAMETSALSLPCSSTEPVAAIAERTAIPSTIPPGLASSSTEPKLDAIVHQHLEDWRLMIRQERMYMMQGPKITIYIGATPALTTSKRAAMAVSRTLNAHFTANPESTRFNFRAGKLTKKAIHTLLKHWLRETCKTFEAREVLLHNHYQRNIAQAREDIKVGDFELDVAVLRASRLLGMEKYTKSIMKYYVNYIRTGMPQHKEIAYVEAMQTHPKDPLWTAMINRLAYLQYNNQIENSKKFFKLLKKHPDLSNRMESADQYFRSRAASNRRDSDHQVHPEGDYLGQDGKYQMGPEGAFTPAPEDDYTPAPEEDISAKEAILMWIESPDPVRVLYQALWEQGSTLLPIIRTLKPANHL